MQVRSLGWEDPLEEETATHSNILACKIHGQRTLVGYRSWDFKDSDTTEVTKQAHTHTANYLTEHTYQVSLILTPTSSTYYGSIFLI